MTGLIEMKKKECLDKSEGREQTDAPRKISLEQKIVLDRYVVELEKLP